MFKRMAGAVALTVALTTAVLMTTVSPASAFDETKYPDLSGQWRKPPGIGNQWDQSKPLGRAQQPPLTPEYQAVFEASMADQSEGGQGNDPPSRCVPFGMPRIMTVVFSMEIVVKPQTTHILFDHSLPRRIYTDGRDWPSEIEPSFLGYSIGKWVDEDGDGRYDVLEIETRGLKGPRTYEGTGMPFHEDNETVLKERIYLDKANPDVLRDEITTIDHALTPSLGHHQDLPARPHADLVPVELCGGQSPRADRQGGLLPQRGWPVDAGQAQPDAAGPAIFQAIAELTVSVGARAHATGNVRDRKCPLSQRAPGVISSPVEF
jgi:hypothetical protein